MENPDDFAARKQLEQRIDEVIATTEVRSDFDPRLSEYRAWGNFAGERIAASMDEEESMNQRLSFEEAKAEVMRRLYHEARRCLQAKFLNDEDAKLGLGYAGPVLK